MNKTVLYMLISAMCTSSWWAAARWPGSGEGILFFPAVVLTVAVVIVVAWETMNAWDC